MCAGDTAFHDLDTVDLTLTREQAKHLRRMMHLEAEDFETDGGTREHYEVAKRILEQLPQESC